MKRFLQALLLSAVAVAQAEALAPSTTTGTIAPTADLVLEAYIPVITEPPEVVELRRRQNGTSNSLSAVIGYYPWPDERNGPQCMYFIFSPCTPVPDSPPNSYS